MKQKVDTFTRDTRKLEQRGNYVKLINTNMIREVNFLNLIKQYTFIYCDDCIIFSCGNSGTYINMYLLLMNTPLIHKKFTRQKLVNSILTVYIFLY